MTRWILGNPIFAPRVRQLALGMGLIGIGKPWGHVDDEVPDNTEVQKLLVTAFELGFRYFDTAPSYGVSEQRFATFLRNLGPAQRASLTVATKFGEHWDAERAQPYVDHSYDALVRSIDGSLEKLGRIDFLQLHKTTPEALRSEDVERAFTYAISAGIPNIGASVSDLESASLALATNMFSVLQFPMNRSSLQFCGIARQATEAGILVATNRPFAMGSLLYGEARTTRQEAFEFLRRQPFDGVVLTGTKSVDHLRENWHTFHGNGA